ncbi:DNA-binding response regulator [Niveispirillum sp.]|uniref:response regulator transcription factor n=1 Tax=Niveispirillum sp. TaxID=1917217 RepID=UPI001B714B36|nr:response regulator transcription factor [Niveispirillum sp.]MBP7334518.1 response regulator transcription factor [Niveispirillum sp.]
MIRVVVAEDQSLVLAALSALIALDGDIEVVAQARDGAAALDAVRRLSPDLLLSDIEMPGMTGLEVADAIRAEGLKTRVVIVTTFGRAGYLKRALAAGVRGYLLKDAPPEMLTRALRQVAAGGKAIAPELAASVWDVGDDPLTDRERTIIRLAEEGRTNKEIALLLDLSPGTVRNYLSEAVLKLGATNRIDAARIARSQGWL